MKLNLDRCIRDEILNIPILMLENLAEIQFLEQSNLLFYFLKELKKLEKKLSK